MDGSTVLWIVLAVIAVLVLVALVVMMMRRTSDRRLDRDREAAHELRQLAAAEQELAESERLEAGAHERSRIAEQSRYDPNERLRRAGALDPDSVVPDTGWQRNPDTSDTSWRPEPRPPRAEEPSGERESDPRLADPGWQAGQPPAAGGHARYGSAEAEDDVEQHPRHAHRRGA